LKPQPLKRGDTLGVIAPAYRAADEKLDQGIRYLENLGYKIRKGSALHKSYGLFAGSDEERVIDLHTMFADPEVKAIISARGGWGGLRLVDRIDFDLIRRNPKIFVGYSDITTLQLAMYHKTGMITFSGPMVAVEMASDMPEFTAANFWPMLLNEQDVFHFDFETSQIETINSGVVSGKLLGGCLSLITAQLGTPFFPDFTDSILFIEDIGERPYKIDRYLAQLKQAGVLDRISGVLIGEFIDCQDPEEVTNSLSLDEILHHYFTRYTYPVVKGFPYGHSMHKATLPLGALTHLDTGTGLVSIENPFSEFF